MLMTMGGMLWKMLKFEVIVTEAVGGPGRHLPDGGAVRRHGHLPLPAGGGHDSA